MNKHLIALGCVLASAGAATGIVAAAGAQEAPQRVAITISASSARITGADALEQGYTRLVFRSSGKGERGFALFRLAPGVTRAQLEAQARRITSPSAAERLGTFVASGFVEGSRTYTTSILLDRSSEYALVRFTGEAAEVEGWLATGEGRSNAPVPAPDVRVTLNDYRFGGGSTLPRDGTIQVLNSGRVQHHALIFPLARGVDAEKVLRALKAGREPSPNAFGGPPSALTEVVSPATTNERLVTVR